VLVFIFSLQLMAMAANINSVKTYKASHMFLANEANGCQDIAGCACKPVDIPLCLHISVCVFVFACVCVTKSKSFTCYMLN